MLLLSSRSSSSTSSSQRWRRRRRKRRPLPSLLASASLKSQGDLCSRRQRQSIGRGEREAVGGGRRLPRSRRGVRRNSRLETLEASAARCFCCRSRGPLPPAAGSSICGSE
ncbi:hypothetical protein L596_012678 [Steinernema carpocapsae]|uniref:Uncharacterized protein n=1 Tax=Steinernema carpocapsae TaxID=34508 RepID=A0A4U5NXT9_STECR|nr:hypothetical protein L596_012678 [Steinernema carpocapsae]